MRSTYLTNLLLLVVAILLIWLMTESRLDSPVTVITNKLVADNVTDIRIERQGQTTIHLQKKTLWQLTSPALARASQTRINLLLSLLDQPVRQHIALTDKTQLAEFGLQEAEHTLILNESRFAFGNTEPLSGYRYILHDGQIYLLQDDISPLLGASASSFVDNRLLDPASHIQKLSLPALADGTGELTIYQQNNRWHSAPENHAQDKLLALLQNWQQAYAMQVLILPEAIEDKQPNLPQVVIQLSDGSSRHFMVDYDETGLTLTDPVARLTYQFPAAMQQPLFSVNP